MEHFDDIFKKKLENYDSGKPEHLWDGIQQELKRQSAPSFPHWIWASLGTGLAIVAGIAAFFLLQPDHHAPVVPTDIPPAAQQLPDYSGTQEGLNAAQEETSADNTVTLAEASRTAAAINGKKASAYNNTDSGNDDKDAENTSAPSARFNWDWNPDIDAIVKAMEAEEKALAARNAAAAAEKTKTTVPAVTVSPDPVAANTFAGITTTATLHKTPALLSRIPQSLPSSEDLHMKMCYSFGGSCDRLYFEPFAAAEYTSIAMQPRNEESRNYMNARLSTEQPLVSPASGIRLSYITCGGVAIRSGLHFQTNTFRFDFRDDNAVQNSTVNILVDTIFPSPGDTIFVWDTLSVVQHGTLLAKTYNHFRSIDIPLILGYELETYKWVFSINAGAIFNIISWQKGEILNPESERISINSADNTNTPVFKTNTGISLTANLGFYYKLPNHSQILFEPYFRYPLKSVTVADYPLVEKHITGGLRVGLRIPISR